MARLIDPVRVSGTNDYGPIQMRQRHTLLEKIMAVYQRYGFEELETPAMESSRTLLGDQGDELIWRTQPWSVARELAKINRVATSLQDWQNRVKKLADAAEIALRFDHTVPLARYVAANSGQLRLPWRRWCFGPVWRGGATGAGRFSQFYQLDADIVGDASLVADAEIIAMMTQVLAAVTSHPTTVRWNNRKLLNALATCLGIEGVVLNPQTMQTEPRANELFRVLDKLDKAGWDGVRTILERAPDNEDDTLALALTPDQVALVERFLDATTQGDSPDAMFSRLEALIGSVPIGAEGLAEMRTMSGMLASMGVSTAVVDTSIARGLGYYTGPVFESSIEGAERFGSPYSGGRFDDLVARFTGNSLPSTGASVGFDRLFAILEELGDLPQVRASPVNIVIMDFGVTRDPDGDPCLRAKVLQTLAALRRGGYNARIYDGENSGMMKTVIGNALEAGIGFMVIAGARELADDRVNVKNLLTRSQRTVRINELVDDPQLKCLLDKF